MKIDQSTEKIMTMFLVKECLNTISNKDQHFDIMMEAVLSSMADSKDENSFLDLLNNGSKGDLSNLNNENISDYKTKDDERVDVLNNIANLKSSANKNIYNSSNLKDGDRIDNAIKNASKKYGVEPNLIRAIIKVESNFNPKAASGAGALGLMQLMRENCKHYGVKDPYNIEENIDAGTRHIKDYLKMFNGNLEMALMAYNAGEGTMQRRGVKSTSDLYKMPKETRNYVPKVMNYYRQGV